MRVNELGAVEHPDFNNVVIHFTGRRGVERRASAVKDNDDLGRLRSIVGTRRLLGFDGPGISGAPSVCLTEATADGCSWLLSSGRYTSCGIAFHKDYLFKVGGGPVLQVRGDEWDGVRSWPPSMRARAVRLWPGAQADPGERLPWWLSGRSEWSYEREWRVPTPEGHLEIDLAQVAFLVVPSEQHLRAWVASVHAIDRELSRWLARSRWVVLGPGGVERANGVRLRRSPASVSGG